MRLHVPCLPHTTLTEKDSSCAYSMKILKAVPMWMAEGHEVFLYGPDEIECAPTEHVIVSTEADRLRWGYGGPSGYDTTKEFLWDVNAPYWLEVNTRAADAIKERVQSRDLLCLITSTQGPIAEAVSGPRWNNPITVEWGVGYIGVDSRSFHAFESYAWMHHVYGLLKVEDGRAFDQVIPNFFDASQFSVARKPRDDYLLYIGRVIVRKGPHIAAEIAKRADLPLVVAGPGARISDDGTLATQEGVPILGDVRYVGAVGFSEHNQLMRNAVATLVPTTYIEPFGGVAVESMLAGTPVVASDWGAFTETVTPDVGARFRTLSQGVAAVRHARSLPRKEVRRAAMARYSQEAVGPLFTAWFEQLQTLWEEGWYA